MDICTIIALLTLAFSIGKCRAFRAIVFMSMGLFGLIPAIHAVAINWNDPHRNITLGYKTVMALSYITGAMFYISRISQRWKPGFFSLTDLRDGELINGENFNLFAAISALEVVMAVSYKTGTVFYISQIPERWKPGFYDLTRHSHQNFHVFVVLDTLAHYGAAKIFLDYRSRLGLETGKVQQREQKRIMAAEATAGIGEIPSNTVDVNVPTMDPEMDSGIVSTYCSVDETIERGAAPVPLRFDRTIDIQCTMGVMDHLLACEATWINGHSLAKTVFSCIYLLRPDRISSHTLLHSYCVVLTCNAVVSAVSDARTNEVNFPLLVGRTSFYHGIQSSFKGGRR
ncbi:hypothetical protein ACH5RR_004366 [Cinchona calisaya]|uniref:NAA35-like N-terminal domain-containing protein n=1 Tax=Cinchona calisaya TaxID=153742 RepID=A0ABD3AXF1_9GENT